MDERRWLGYSLRSKLYPGEAEYFKANPNVSGMAAEDSRIILNPYADPSIDFDAVARNEALRLFMRERGVSPEFEVTEAQRDWFRTNAPQYVDDPAALRQTILGRLYSGDNQFQFTPEQRAALERVLRSR